MSDTTDKRWPPPISSAPPPSTLAERIVAEAVSHLGEHEDRGDGKANNGRVVVESCRWLVADEEEFNRLYAAGKLEWCVGGALTVLRDAGSQAVHKLKTLRCTRLWEKAEAAAGQYVIAWTPKIAAEVTDSPLMSLQPGDLLLTDSDRNGKPGHVVIVESVFGDEIETIGANSGPKSDEWARKTYKAGDPRLFGFIRVLA